MLRLDAALLERDFKMLIAIAMLPLFTKCTFLAAGWSVSGSRSVSASL